MKAILPSSIAGCIRLVILFGLTLSCACGRPEQASPAAPESPAWHEDVVYQIFPRAFQDSNGDGIGDLAGVTQRVPYLQKLGVNVVWLNPIYPSGNVDSGYDVADLTGIDPVFGNLDDFAKLSHELHTRGMKLMLDLVLNHTSDQHPWFTAEVGRKHLQKQLTELLAKADRAEGEAIVALLVDPNSRADTQGTHLAAAQEAIASYMSRDDSAAEMAGYPSHAEAAHRLADTLDTCVGRPAGCLELPMPFDDFYIWRAQPNNWTSLFMGSVWRPIAEVGGFCMHIFSAQQIDLNWRNPQVREAMAHAAAVWQSRGVDGFRLDSINTLAKDPQFPYDPGEGPGIDGRGMRYFSNLEQVHRYLREFASRLSPNASTVGEVAFNRPDAPLQYAGSLRHELREVFVFDHVGLDFDGTKFRKKAVSIPALKRVLAAQQELIHGHAWLGNYFENHDQLRIVSHYGDAERYPVASAQAFAALLMTLEGTPFVYQGQELGMTDLPPHTFASVDQIEDVEARNWLKAKAPLGDPQATLEKVASRARDNVRTAVQWAGDAQAGFTTGTSQVRVNPNCSHLNAEAEGKDPHSVLASYSKLIALRRQHREWVEGPFEELIPTHPKVFSYRRTLGTETSWVIINLSSEAQTVDLPADRLPGGSSEVLYTNVDHTPALTAHLQLAPWQATIYGSKP